VVIDYLTLENEVLRVCDARQVLVNRLLNTTASVEKRASELLAKKSNIVAKEWAASEVAVLEAERLALEERTRAARVIEAKSEDNPDFNTEAVSSNLPKASIASCRPDYRVTSIVGSAGKARANILGPNGDSYSVAAGDALPFGVKILAVGQGLVTIEYDGGRDVLAFLPDETRASIELSEEGFITLPLAPKSVVGGN
jgi:type IV pilus biogenesis protein PilP